MEESISFLEGKVRQGVAIVWLARPSLGLLIFGLAARPVSIFQKYNKYEAALNLPGRPEGLLDHEAVPNTYLGIIQYSDVQSCSK